LFKKYYEFDRFDDPQDIDAFFIFARHTCLLYFSVKQIIFLKTKCNFSALDIKMLLDGGARMKKFINLLMSR
jgi:hypothetical protein